MGIGARTLRAALAVASVITFGIVAGAAPAAAVPPGPTDQCWMIDDPQWDEFRALTQAYADSGQLDPQIATTFRCDPRKTANYMTDEVVYEPVFTPMWLSGCKESGGWVYVWKVAGIEIGRHRSTLNWCWNSVTRKVSDWTGACSGSTSGYGKSVGWNWQGCSQNDFIAYTLNGSYPGGVHHVTEGHWSNVTPWTTDKYLKINIWGHYDGTCDVKLGSTTHPYC